MATTSRFISANICKHAISAFMEELRLVAAAELILKSQNRWSSVKRMAGPQDEINRIERELDKEGGKLKKPQQSGKTTKHQSLGTIVGASGLLVVVAFAIVFGGRLNVTQRAGMAGGVLGGAAGLLVGYGVGRIR